MPDIMYAYTRKEAIENGDQVLLTGKDADAAREAGYRYPVYLTRSINELIKRAVANKKHCNDRDGVLWDILWMSRRMPTEINASTMSFPVIITGVGRKRNHRFLIQCGAKDIDDATPVLTIMHPSEI